MVSLQQRWLPATRSRSEGLNPSRANSPTYIYIYIHKVIHITLWLCFSCLCYFDSTLILHFRFVLHISDITIHTHLQFSSKKVLKIPEHDCGSVDFLGGGVGVGAVRWNPVNIPTLGLTREMKELCVHVLFWVKTRTHFGGVVRWNLVHIPSYPSSDPRNEVGCVCMFSQ